MTAHVPARSKPELAAVCALAALAGCHGSAHVEVGSPAEPVYVEVEANDDADSANWFGVLAPGDRVHVEGTVRDDAFDPQDGFAFDAAGSIVVDFALDADCGCADLDVWVYDPIADAFVGVFDSPHDPERGTLTVHDQPFHLVVVSSGGDAAYHLDVRATSLHTIHAEDGAASALALGGESRAAAPTAAVPPTAPLARYARGVRAVGAPVVSEAFVIDPQLGVVARGFVRGTVGGD